jgi:hypothetical protein
MIENVVPDISCDYIYKLQEGILREDRRISSLQKCTSLLILRCTVCRLAHTSANDFQLAEYELENVKDISPAARSNKRNGMIQE